MTNLHSENLHCVKKKNTAYEIMIQLMFGVIKSYLKCFRVDLFFSDAQSLQLSSDAVKEISVLSHRNPVPC